MDKWEALDRGYNVERAFHRKVARWTNYSPNGEGEFFNYQCLNPKCMCVFSSEYMVSKECPACFKSDYKRI